MRPKSFVLLHTFLLGLSNKCLLRAPSLFSSWIWFVESGRLIRSHSTDVRTSSAKRKQTDTAAQFDRSGGDHNYLLVRKTERLPNQLNYENSP